MSFWNEASVEPKRKYRWILHVDAIPAWIIKKVTKPAITVSEVKHSFINHGFYYPGRVEYNEVEFTLVDPFDPDAAASFMALLQGSGYAVPDAYTEATQTITKFAATESLGQLKISQLSGLGVEFDGGAQDPIEEWTLHNCWIKEVNYGDLDYESDDINEITVKVRYDWATLTQSGAATTEAENRRRRADAP
tara:strand:- start:181 stop:756 length:576 start_codon:yes stop_codon:yes gene_type:complete